MIIHVLQDRSPGGPIKEEQIEESSELMMQKTVTIQIEKDKVIETYVTHRQEFEEQAQVQQGREQDKQDSSLSDQAETIGAEDHSYRHGSQLTPWEPVD